MVPSYGEGFFCNTPLVFDISGDPILSPSCDVTHNHVTSCDLVDLISVGRQRIPEEYRYFTDQDLGPLYSRKQAEFCPMPSIELYSCQDEAGIPLLMGESFGRNSKCFEFEMTTTAQIQPNAFCLNLECNQEAYKVHVLVNGANITCDHDGQQHVLPGFRTDIYPMILNMTFSCPRISTVCPHLVCPGES